MTRINPNDPKWTAYVLGELDKAESEAVERLLASSEEARALVDDLKAASLALTEAFEEAPADVLTPPLVQEVFGVACEVVPDPLTGTPLVVPVPSAAASAWRATSASERATTELAAVAS